MASSTCNSVPVSVISNILAQNKLFLRDWATFAYVLQVSFGKIRRLEQLINYDTIGYIELFNRLLEEWIFKCEENSTTALGKLLKDNSWVDLADEIGKLGHCKITGRDLPEENEVKKAFKLQEGPKEPVANFVGRDNDLNKLTNLYESGRVAEVLITGLGGVGKTEFTKRFIKQMITSHPFTYTWLSGSDADATWKSVVSIAEKILPGKSDANIETFNQIVKVIKAESRYNWVIVIDNLDDANPVISEMVKALRVANAENPSTRTFMILTSRLRTLDWITLKHWIELKVLEPEDCSQFFKNELGKENVQDIEKLGKTLQYLPLAMQQASSYILSETPMDRTFGIAKYIQLFENMQSQKLLGFSKECDSTYGQTILITWNITIQKIESTPLIGELARKLLNILAFLDPDGTTYNFLQDRYQRLPEGIHMDSETFNSVIRLIKKFSMITEDEKIIRIHRLCQHVIRLSLHELDPQHTLVGGLLRNLDIEGFKSQNITHALYMWNYSSEEDEMVQQFFEIPNKISYKLKELAKYTAAFDFATKNHARLLKVLGDTHIGTLSMERNIAVAQKDNGEAEKSLSIYRDVLQRMKSNYSEDHDEVLSTQNYMAMALLSLRRKNEARDLLRRTLSARQTKSPNEDFWTAVTKNDLAVALDDAEEAMELNKEVLNWRIDNLGESNWLTILSAFNICVELYQLSKLEEAKTELSALHKLSKSCLGEDHSLYLSITSFLAKILNVLGEHDAALILMKENFDCSKKRFGDKSPQTWVAGITAAIYMYQQGHCEEGRKSIEELSLSQTVAEETPLTTKVWMASTFAGVGQYQMQLQTLQEMQTQLKSIFPDNHSAILLTRLKAGICLYRLEMYLEAKLELEDLLTRYQEINGGTHNLSLSTETALAMTLIRMNEFESGSLHLTNVYLMRLNAPVSTLNDIINARHNVGWALLEQGRDFEAKLVFEEILPIERCAFGEYNQLTIATMSVLGSVLVRLNEFPRALALLEKSRKLKEITRGKFHPDALAANHHLAMCLQEYELLTDAKQTFEQNLKSKIHVFGRQHLSTLATISGLAICLHKLGDTVTGLKMLREVYSEKISTLDTLHPSVLSTRHQIAWCLLHQGLHEEARKEFEEVLHHRKSKLGETHLLTLLTMHWLGVTLFKLGKSKEALQLLQTVLLNREAVRGPRHPATEKTRKVIREIQDGQMSWMTQISNVVRRNLFD